MKRRPLSQNTEVKILAVKRTEKMLTGKRKKNQMNITNCWRKRSEEVASPGGCWAEMSREEGNVAANKWWAIKTGTVKEKTNENKKPMGKMNRAPHVQTHTHTRTGFQWASGGRGLPPGTALWEAGVVQSMVARARAFQTLQKRLRGTWNKEWRRKNGGVNSAKWGSRPATWPQ